MTVTEFGAVYSEGVNHFYVVGEPVVMVIDTERYLSAPSAYSAGITWESDNEEIAVVSDDGKISAVGEGHATITARNEDGIIVTFDITVESRSDTEASDKLRDASDVNSKVSDEKKFRKDMFINGRSFDGNLKYIRGEYDFIVNKFAQKGRTAIETHPSAWMLFDDPTDKQWNNNRLYYMETRKHLQRTFRHRLSHAVDQLLLHANLLFILSAIVWCIVRLVNQNYSTSTWAVGAAAILALLITFIMRSLFASNVFKVFHEDIPAWKVLPFESSVIWRQIFQRMKYQVADKYDFISHKV